MQAAAAASTAAVARHTYFCFEMTTFPTSSPGLAFFQHCDIYFGTYKIKETTAG